MHPSRAVAWRLLQIPLLLGAVAVLIAPPDTPWTHSWQWRIGGLVVIVAAVLAYDELVTIRPLLHRPRDRKVEQVRPGQALTLQQQARSNRLLTSFQVQAFAFAVRAPAAICQRIVEEIEPGRRTLHRTVTIEAQVPPQVLKLRVRDSTDPPPGAAAPGDTEPAVASAAAGGAGQPAPAGRGDPDHSPLYFPIIFVQKGRLHDNLEVVDAEGRFVPVTTYPEYLQTVASALRTLLLEAYADSSARKPALPRVAEVVERSALIRIISRVRDERTSEETERLRKEEIEQRYRSEPEPGEGDLRTAHFRGCVTELEERYFKAAGAVADGVAMELDRAEKLLGEYVRAGEELARATSQEQVSRCRARQDAVEVKLLRCPPELLIEALPGAHRTARRLASELVRDLVDNYLVLAKIDMPEDGRFIVRYRDTVVPQLSLDVPRKRRVSRAERGLKATARKVAQWLMKCVNTLIGLFRIGFGARPVSAFIPLMNAGRSQSYHLNVKIPDGLYLHTQELIAGDYLERRADNAPTKPYLRFRRRLGQAYAHLYCRFFPPYDSAAGTPELRCEFREVPPGSAFRAMAAAAASAAVITVVGALRSYGYEFDRAADVPALLLALPAVAATFLGFDAPSRRLIEPALAARISLAVTAVLSIGASALYLVEGAAVRRESGSLYDIVTQDLPWQLSVLGITNRWWGLLALVAVLSALLTARHYLLQVLQFTRLASRHSRHDGGARVR